ncbi:MAG: DNA/RNA non-specific endonuclease, partial [Planctomycetes bacterium]|nr:DNA/RNA non-specific endonuclease [Planctomycetota bacterium]
MDKQTKSILATVLTLAIAFVSWLIVQTKKKEQPPEVPPPTEHAPLPRVPGEPAPKTNDTQPTPSEADSSIHLLMGNPSRAVADTKDPDNYLIRKAYFALSYNRTRGTPNWVSWCLQKSDFGPGDRVEFYPDASLPSAFKRIVPRDYTNSGFDRGHLCPRSDRTATQEMATATFVMTNITPQSPHLNQRGWADLEEYSRGLAKHGSTLYIVAGVQGIGGEGSMGKRETIGGDKVTVPAKCWKVILVIGSGTGTASDIEKIGSTTRTIAIVMPNDQ